VVGGFILILEKAMMRMPSADKVNCRDDVRRGMHVELQLLKRYQVANEVPYRSIQALFARPCVEEIELRIRHLRHDLVVQRFALGQLPPEFLKL
jgi:hypothetical protein